MNWIISPAVAITQMAATMALADSGNGNSVLFLYLTPKPIPGDSAGGDAQVTIELAKPCAQMLSPGVWKLLPENPEGSMVLETGAPIWGRWFSAGGEWLGDATDSDPTGDGGIKISGGAVAPGASSPTLFAGGLALLGLVSFS
jgi:hypothetical protein